MTIQAMARFIDILPCGQAWRSCQIAGRGAGRATRPPRAAGLATLLVLALLGGCATLPAPPAKAESHARAPAADGSLAAIAKASTPPGDDLSGFRLLPLGPFALDARLQLIDRAAHTLEAQYYVFDNDPTGRRMMGRLLAAAQRGVRVRLLVDDLYTVPTDPLLRMLAEQPNVEVRLFNPFCCARDSSSGRFTVALFDLYRLNHRMHNKLLVADGRVAIAGGRNVADEYFMLNMSGNFVDMDALIMGAVVPQLQAIFDRYWNSDVVWSIQALVPAERALPLADFERQVAADPPPPPLAANDALGYGPVSEELEAGRIGLIWAPARAFADPPNKLEKMTPEEAREMSVSKEVRMEIWSARHDLVITSPYMIPGPMGIEAFEQLGARKVRTVVVTNSLAATDEPLVHTGYARYRPQLLAYGVDLYEISPERTRRTQRLGMFGSSFGRLHAKTAVVDQRTVFIGSMNLDPRSDTQNTELGLFVDSPQLAKELLRIVNISKLQSAYRVRMGPDGQLEWLTMDDEHEMVLTEEPEASFWMRVQNMLVAPFVPEQLL